ncbi:MAG: hypothetical protein WC538_06110 [Thermoanaerobaculia bacterium]|jgi:hypothetical protein
MRQQRLRFVALVPFVILLASCGGGGGPAAPTAPSPGLTGTWSGTLALRGGLDAGQPVALELLEREGRVSGVMTDWESMTWSVDGDERLLSAVRMPATSTCSAIELSIEEIKERSDRPVEFSGSLTGRCYGTAAGTFRLTRN